MLLVERLRAAIAKLNPTLNAETRAEVLAKLTQTETPSLVEENRRLHRYMIEGVPVEVRRADGSISGEQVRLIDFDDPDANDWLAVNQYTVIENKANRRPDVVIFVNGMPLGVIELKNPGDENATLDGAFNQLQTYKSQITSLFRTNAVLVISDGIAARIGSLTADRERFMPWRTVAGDALAAKGTPELETVLKGVFDRRRFLDLVKDFIVFGDTGSDVAKILAGYHQFHAVRKAVESTLSATAAGGDRKAGVIWHTQGSGKSLLMAFYAGQIIKHPAMQNPTLVVLTDRNDLDDQLFGTFSMCKDLLRQTPQQAEDREHLRKLLDRPSGGVIFTTLQKFSPEDGTTNYPAAHGPTQRGRDRRRGPPQPVRVPREGREQDRRDFLRLCQVSARRSAQRLLHRLHRDAHRERTMSTRRRCSATTSTSTTSAVRSRTARRCRSTTRAGWHASNSTRTRSPRSTPKSQT